MYRKFSADHIFNGYQLLPGNRVLITTREGVVVDMVAKEDAGDDVEQLRGILSPGFINAHCHLELSHMKGHIPEKTGLVDFILKVVFERHYQQEEILDAINQAEASMMQNGIAAVGDICNNILTLQQKLKGNLRYQNFIEASGFTPGIAESRFKQSTDFYHSYAAVSASNAIVPHAPYSVSPELFNLINLFPGNRVLTIHNQETAAENELYQNRQGDFLDMYRKMNIDASFFKAPGKTSLQWYLPMLNRYQSLILVHNVCTSADDIEFEKLHSSRLQLSSYYCLCPNANLYITGVLPDVNLMVKQQCNIVIGTDSLASNHHLSLLEEIKTIQQNFPGLTLETLLQWATINGAKALQMEKELGSFEKGKKPGIVLIEGLSGQQLASNGTSRRLL